jgi:hypothetical protein
LPAKQACNSIICGHPLIDKPPLIGASRINGLDGGHSEELRNRRMPNEDEVLFGRLIASAYRGPARSLSSAFLRRLGSRRDIGRKKLDRVLYAGGGGGVVADIRHFL